MAKRKIGMNAAELERYEENKLLTQLRREVRERQKTEKPKAYQPLVNTIKELKFKRRLPGVYNRAMALGEVPWA